MIDAIRVNEVIKNMSADCFEIVRKYDTIDALYGLEHRRLTNKDIKALKDGNFLYCTDGEYAQIISYDPQESED
jgi:hypothetical protein